ncbi:MAG: hypothetical protein HQ517_10105, partial [SAR324 cluster bacterium]|nr:hypothetical protein [SAR324 cluster bacterium]
MNIGNGQDQNHEVSKRPSNNAWVYVHQKEEPDSEYKLSLKSTDSNQSSVLQGDALLIVIQDPKEEEFITFSRVYRVRHTSSRINLFFDKKISLKGKNSISEYGISVPGQSLTRIEWSVFENIIHSELGSPFSSLPMMDGTT